MFAKVYQSLQFLVRYPQEMRRLREEQRDLERHVQLLKLGMYLAMIREKREKER